MPHFLGDHNAPIVELYVGEFETKGGGSVILECWSLEPVDAADAFRRFFDVANDHPDYQPLSDNSPVKSGELQENQLAIWQWWRDKPVWTGDYIEMRIEAGTRVTIGESIIEYNGTWYNTWSKAYLSKRDKIVPTNRISLRTHALQDAAFRRLRQ